MQPTLWLSTCTKAPHSSKLSAGATPRCLVRYMPQLLLCPVPTTLRPGITFGSHMLPNLLHWLLVQQGQYRIEMYEGSGSAWQCTKYVDGCLCSASQPHTCDIFSGRHPPDAWPILMRSSCVPAGTQPQMPRRCL